MKRILSTIVLAAAFATPAIADEAHHKKPAQGASQAADMAEGEVRRVDRDAKKVTLRHGPIANLDMPAHTMVFQVRDPGMLEQVKPGDKVRFEAEKDSGIFIITRIEVAK